MIIILIIVARLVNHAATGSNILTFLGNDISNPIINSIVLV